MTGILKTWNELESGLREISERGPDRRNFYETAPKLINSYISKLVLYDDSTSLERVHKRTVNLVHYTTWENALAMFCEDQKLPPVLRMYNLEHSNDPNEGKIKPPEWKEVETNAKWIDETLKEDSRWIDLNFGGSTYSSSFSSGPSGVEDDLTYWRMYGNDGEGCSLKIVLPTGDQYRAYKIRYRNENSTGRSKKERQEDREVADRLAKIFAVGKEIVDKLDEHQNEHKILIAGGLRQILYNFCHLVKDQAYVRESEWRMINVIPNLDSIRFDTMSKKLVKRYIEGPLLKDLLSTDSTITIGPTVPNRGAARAYLEHLIKVKHGIQYVSVKNSNKTYRRL